MVLSQSLPLESQTAASELTSISQKFAALRSQLSKYQLDGYFVPSADEHLNEYLPEAKQRRQWISEFTGSAGDFLISGDRAWVFVDSRYYEQADMQVDTNLQKVCKVGLEDHQTVEEVLEELGQKLDQKPDQKAIERSPSFRLGIDPFTITIAQYQRFSERLSLSGVEIVPIIENLVDAVRSQSPWIETEPMLPFGDQPVIALPDTITGESLAKKLERVRADMVKKKAAILPVTKLDQIAWLYNLRGRDVECNPVFISYAIVTLDNAYLFTNTARIDVSVRQALAEQVQILEYDRYIPTLRSLVGDRQRVLVASSQTTLGTYLQLKEVNAPMIGAEQLVEHPVETFKALKNPVEIAQMQQANLKASFAKTLTLKWIEEQITAGNPISEKDVAQKIEGLYKQQEGFVDLSFPTIAGAGANGSIVHYSNPNPDCKLLNGDLLLLDSGSQFYGGTTDDTRSISIGEPTAEQRDRYTEVLKSHINCAMQKFPKGTTGSQIDGIARASLWQSGLDYGHGTGHGVGAFLNVHEGPNGISKRVNQALALGTINSIEPGYYQPKWGGIRLENLYFVKEVPKPIQEEIQEEIQEPTTNSTPWYEFASLTYIPFDKKLIDRHKLNPPQITWLENYYAIAIAKLAPMLTVAETAWLKQACTF